MSTAPIKPSMAYYLSLFTSQYQQSPNLLAFAQLLMQPFLDVTACADSLSSAFNINPALGATAVGVQLDAVGTVVGAKRNLPFNPLGYSALTTAAITSTGVQSVDVNNTLYAQIGELVTITGSDSNTETVTLLSPLVQGVSVNANFTKTHVSGSSITSTPPSATLDDAHFLTLIQAKILFNQFNGLYFGPSSVLWSAWQTLFPGGRIYITDNQNMTATLFLVGAFDPLYQQMITNGMIVPRAETVEFIYEFAILPLFGFDNLNPTFVAGFDSGHWG